MQQENERLLTVSEFARASGVSVQAVYKRLRRSGSSLQAFCVEKEGQKYIRASALAGEGDKPPRQQPGAKAASRSAAERFQADEIAALKAQLAVKDAQISAQNELLSEMQRNITQLTQALQTTSESLKAAQALHAGTIQQQIAAQPAADPSGSEPQQVEPSTRRGLFDRFKRKK